MQQYYIFLIFFLISSTNINATAIDSLKLADYLAQNNIEATPASDGLLYQIDKIGSGDFPKPGDYIKLHYTGKLTTGDIFDQSNIEDPFVFQLGFREVIRGWDKGIPFFQVGSKGQLFIPSELAYGRFGAGKMIPPHADLIFDIEVLEIMDADAYDKYMIELEKKERAAYETHIKKQFTVDKKLIQDYAITHKIKSKRTSSGLSYSIQKKGKGANAQVGDRLKVEYEGFLINDEKFDSNVNKKPFGFELGKQKVIKGWDEGLQYFNEGSEGYLLIPSQLAYGARAIEEEVNGELLSIPSDAVLIFYIKVLEIERDIK